MATEHHGKGWISEELLAGQDAAASAVDASKRVRGARSTPTSKGARPSIRCAASIPTAQALPNCNPPGLVTVAETTGTAGTPVLKIEGLKAYYRAKDRGLAGLAGRHGKGFVKAVDGVNLAADNNSTLGIVGESGCGKTTLAKCIAGLMPANDGSMAFGQADVARSVEERPVATLKELQMIFQNPDSTLNPKRTAGEAIARPLQLFGTVPPAAIRNEVLRLLEAVRLGEEYYDRLPTQLSGGEKQRVALARAFAGRPTLVLCDEPLSALDVSVQAAIMNLLQEFQREYGTTILFISHDLSAVYQLCDTVAVM
ncbi:MAG: ATP-binding cassette domain-containing protein [Gammaproteobacteria bacterium]|nr:ATP-binding cassette domain-containing protein [Gammaproteobacteria bacterium]